MKTTGIFKKLFILVFVCALLFVQSVPAMAASKITFTENVQIKDKTIVYEIAISPDSQVRGMSFKLNYSADQVKLNQCETGEILADGMASTNSKTAGKVAFTYVASQPLKAKGTLIHLEFEVISTKNKNIDIDFTNIECLDTNYNILEYTYAKQEIANPQYVEEPTEQGGNDSPDTTVPDQTKPTEQGNDKNPTTATTPSVDNPVDPVTKPTEDPNVGQKDPTTNSGEGATNPSEGQTPDVTVDETTPDSTKNDVGADDKNDDGAKSGGILLPCLGIVVLLALVGYFVFRFVSEKRKSTEDQ